MITAFGCGGAGFPNRPPQNDLNVERKIGLTRLPFSNATSDNKRGEGVVCWRTCLSLADNGCRARSRRGLEWRTEIDAESNLAS